MILYFDGVCGLCNGLVDFLIRQSSGGPRLRFAPLQGEHAARALAPELRADLTTVVLKDDAGQVWVRSDAVLRALETLGGAWPLLAKIARLVPRPGRDVVYRAVASRRYAWFGKRDACRLPTPAERERLLT